MILGILFQHRVHRADIPEKYNLRHTNQLTEQQIFGGLKADYGKIKKTYKKNYETEITICLVIIGPFQLGPVGHTFQRRMA